LSPFRGQHVYEYIRYTTSKFSWNAKPISGFCCYFILHEGKRIKRDFQPTQRTQRTQRTQEKYATNVVDVVDGTAVLIIIPNPVRYSVVCFCNLMPRNKTNSNHLPRIKWMNTNKSQLPLYLYKKQTPNNLILIINDRVSNGRSLASTGGRALPPHFHFFPSPPFPSRLLLSSPSLLPSRGVEAEPQWRGSGVLPTKNFWILTRDPVHSGAMSASNMLLSSLYFPHQRKANWHLAYFKYITFWRGKKRTGGPAWPNSFRRLCLRHRSLRPFRQFRSLRYVLCVSGVTMG